MLATQLKHTLKYGLWVYGRFVPMHFRSRERNDHTVNFRSRERTCDRFVPGNESAWERIKRPGTLKYTTTFYWQWITSRS